MLNTLKRFNSQGGWFILMFLGAVITATGQQIGAFYGIYGKPTTITNIGQIFMSCGYIVALFPVVASNGFSKSTLWYRPVWASEEYPDEQILTLKGKITFFGLALLLIWSIVWTYQLITPMAWSLAVGCLTFFCGIIYVVYIFIYTGWVVFVWRKGNGLSS